MRILLISVNNEKDPYPIAPIGPAYIGKTVKDNGHSVELIDLCFTEDENNIIIHTLKSFPPDVIGISIRNIDNLTYNKSVFYIPRIKNIVTVIKDNSFAAIVAGGSGFSVFPEEVLRYLNLETGIVGEGEKSFSLFVDAMENGKDTSKIPSLCCIKDSEFTFNKVEFNSSFGRPDNSLLNNKDYYEHGGMANIQSKRGCPFTCNYCTYPIIEGNALRTREPEDIVDELQEIKSVYGIEYFFFVDDIFNYPEAHAAELCEEIIKKDLRIRWACFATPKGMTFELAELMKRAGCDGVEFGSDAGTDKTLSGLGKPFTAGDIEYASNCCKKAELPDAHYVLIGGPEEDNFTLEETFYFFDRLKPTAVIAMVGIRIYPNTLLSVRAVNENIIKKERNLLEPIFYLSPKITIEGVLEKVSAHAEQSKNWIVPAMNIRCNPETLFMLRKMGKKGPLWNLL